MTHWRTVHKRLNKDLLFAEDLGGFGAKPFDCEIIDSGVRKVSDGDDVTDMPWVAIAESPKLLALNVTNCKILQTITGSGEVSDWRGWITLIVLRIKYQDRKTKERLETDAIRIAPNRPAPPKKSSAKPTKPAKPDPLQGTADELLGRYRTCADPATFAALQAERAAIWKKLEPGPTKKALADAAVEVERRLAEGTSAPTSPEQPPTMSPGDVADLDSDARITEAFITGKSDGLTPEEIAEVARLEREGDRLDGEGA